MSDPAHHAASVAAAAARQTHRLVARLLGEAREQLDAVRSEHDELRRGQGRRAAERAALARAGRFGEAVRRLQAEVDAGRTTWAAVLQGGDVSPDAAVARARVTAAVTAVAEGRGGRRSRGPD